MRSQCFGFVTCDDAQIRIFFFGYKQRVRSCTSSFISLWLSCSSARRRLQTECILCMMHTIFQYRDGYCILCLCTLLSAKPCKANTFHITTRLPKRQHLTTTSALLCGGTLLTKEVVHRTLLTLTTSLGTNIVEQLICKLLLSLEILLLLLQLTLTLRLFGQFHNQTNLGQTTLIA